jgi:uncharacterized protein YjaG (DUF416 family)
MSDKRYLSDLSKLVVDTEDGKRRHYQATLDYLYSNLDVLDWLIEQAEKVERYEKALKTIAEHQYYGSIGAIGYYAEFKSIAKQALEGEK